MKISYISGFDRELLEAHISCDIIMFFNLSGAKSISIYTVLDTRRSEICARIKTEKWFHVYDRELYKKNVSFPMTILSSFRLHMEDIKHMWVG